MNESKEIKEHSNKEEKKPHPQPNLLKFSSKGTYRETKHKSEEKFLFHEL
jgi:hypothetical protein